MTPIKLALLCTALSSMMGCSRSEAPKSVTTPAPTPATSVAASGAESKQVQPGQPSLVPSANGGTHSSQTLAGDVTDMSNGAKEALQLAASRAVDELTGPNGFQKNLIPLPPTVEKSRPYLKAAGKEDLLNNFSTAINSAAANAIKQSPAVLNSTVQSMQLSDVTELWRGQNDAFTRYLEKHARVAIVERMMPSIKSATEASGATHTFKQITSLLGEKTGGLLAGIQSATGLEMPNANFDLDNYVSDQAMSSLFNFMAVEEKKLRENPTARSSQLLKSFFSRFEKR